MDTHRAFIDEWRNYGDAQRIDPQMHRASEFAAYLTWLNASTRLHLRPQWTEEDILEEASSEEDNDYDMETRLGRQVEQGPVRDRVVISETFSITSRS
jgi:hypothetical protein